MEEYLYEISGYYFADAERKHFQDEVLAESNTQAMQLVIGNYAWQESIEGHTFKLDCIHYVCL